MPPQITSAFGRITTSVREFTVAQRTLALIGVAVLAVALIGLSAWLSRPQFSPLYTDLAPADASAIVDQLTAQGVAYELTNGGATILVPSDSVYDMRLKIAASGMSPTSEGGYSLLDSMGMSSSEFQQDVTYKRALEGEIGKTVSAMAGVETATVKLAMPEESVFVSTKADPTASVFIKTKSGAVLNDDQVQSIVHLVSASVEGMKTTDVAVIDSTGTVLSAVGSGTAASGANKQTLAYEERVAASIQSMLDPILGVGKAVVTVTADLDYDTTERTQETFNATEGVPALTERSTLEEYTGTNSAATGVLGPDNIAVPDGEDGDGAYRNETAESNNAVDKLTEHTVAAPGTVRRQSVSVAVDQQAAAAINMTDLQAMVSSAAGIDAERGDVVTVARMAFDTSSASAAQSALDAAAAVDAAAAKAKTIQTLVIAGGVLLALVLLAIMLGRRRRPKADPRESLDLGELSLVDDALALSAAALDSATIVELPELPSGPSPEQLQIERKRADVVTLVDEQPEQVAELLREWMDTRSNA
ncbi:flagellar basal-body MS-ring/collar protein FliF [Sanguibacter suarezii]|uniref:flagellar basal-body MS-ring/collar protein FliF n=1 Tax=Sanguibacter suarezii TaxID=60921 RepID=UPI00082F03C7|nr:flagellar basal-body MS-ring/collar protein FliF [Sanguibacter suarezii]